MEITDAFLGFMAGFAIFGTGIAWLAHRRLRAIGRVIDLTDPRQSKAVEYWRRIRGGGLFLLVFCSAILVTGINDRMGDAPTDDIQAVDSAEPGLEVEETLE
ncbi:MAG: hypothetical protein KI792_04375 [Alphaproteobacteria bacterium]|nr:hypothetical protein [Alphaproteobacteria bacterium SS10]